MTEMKLITKRLKFKGFKAVDLWFEGKGEKDLVVMVKPHKNGCRCPQCGRRGQIVRTMEPRRWRAVRVCGRTVWLLHAPREIRCPTHGRRVEQPPWAEPGARVTYRPGIPPFALLSSDASESGCADAGHALLDLV